MAGLRPALYRAGGLVIEHHRRIDIGDLDQLGGSGLRVGIGTIGSQLHYGACSVFSSQGAHSTGK